MNIYSNTLQAYVRLLAEVVLRDNVTAKDVVGGEFWLLRHKEELIAVDGLR